MSRSTVATRHWHRTEDGRVQCDVCPRACRLHEGQRGFCFVRMRQGDAIVLTTYGRSSGYCVDPIEKKPLNHFLPGALGNGIRYAYTGNVHGPAGQSTYCHQCGELVIERDWYRLGAYRLTGDGRCVTCGAPLPGVFEGPPGTWGPRRLPVQLRRPAVRYSGPGPDRRL